MASSDQSGTTSLGRPKPPSAAQRPSVPGAVPRAGVVTSITAEPTKGESNRATPLEFRGFDFFANRDFNELKNASRAYFAPASGSEKHQRLPSTWLGDATPPASPRPSGERLPVGRDELPARPTRQTSQDKKRIFGLRRSQFWWLLALIGLLIIVAIGVGVGVGVGRSVGQNSGDTAAAAAAASASSSSPTNTALGSSTTTSGNPTESSTSSSTTSPSSAPSPTGNAEGKIDCPAANGTIYQVPGSTKQFLRICGIDYSGNEAEDLRQVQTESILDCMKNCAGTFGCTGCGWGYLEGDTGTQHTCWLKGNLKKSHEADINWAFAVLL
ncbi:hypothetical protein F5Y04DRAFT_286059 [Hypomontagnella monticulosa]|nr:hypothetical protein F5Y04DRAFT_286059 [Hypomontagnella monticulosa]